jgi:hypothetical protein
MSHIDFKGNMKILPSNCDIERGTLFSLTSIIDFNWFVATLDRQHTIGHLNLLS